MILLKLVGYVLGVVVVAFSTMLGAIALISNGVDGFPLWVRAVGAATLCVMAYIGFVSVCMKALVRIYALLVNGD